MVIAAIKKLKRKRVYGVLDLQIVKSAKEEKQNTISIVAKIKTLKVWSWKDLIVQST